MGRRRVMTDQLPFHTRAIARFLLPWRVGTLPGEAKRTDICRLADRLQRMHPDSSVPGRPREGSRHAPEHRIRRPAQSGQEQGDQ